MITKTGDGRMLFKKAIATIKSFMAEFRISKISETT